MLRKTQFAFLVYVVILLSSFAEVAYGLTLTNRAKVNCKISIFSKKKHSSFYLSPNQTITDDVIYEGFDSEEKLEEVDVLVQFGSKDPIRYSNVALDSILQFFEFDQKPLLFGKDWKFSLVAYSAHYLGVVIVRSAGVIVGMRQGGIIGSYYGKQYALGMVSSCHPWIKLVLEPSLTVALDGFGAMVGQTSGAALGIFLAPFVFDAGWYLVSHLSSYGKTKVEEPPFQQQGLETCYQFSTVKVENIDFELMEREDDKVD